MILTWSIWLLESYLSTGENESQEKTTLVATDRRIGHGGYPLLSSATVTEVCERLMMVEISLRELVGVADNGMSLRPHLADALFECGVEIEYRLEGNLNHVTVIHTVM